MDGELRFHTGTEIVFSMGKKKSGSGYIVDGQTHYQRNKEYYQRKRLEKREAKKALIRERKSSPCADCGVSYPYYVMDMDHRPGEEKSGEISRLASWPSLKALSDELDKCDAVCANCHRERTQGRLDNDLLEKV